MEKDEGMDTLDYTRRDFLKTIGLGAAALAVPGCLSASEQFAGEHPVDKQAPQPNILWISTEDISPDLGCYGDSYAVTPNLDRFAARAVRYDNAFTTAGVCAPVRSGIITGMYPTMIGTNDMRCKGVPPPQVKCFTEYLRAAGYYCTNRSKTDYQFASPVTAWDDCSKTAHWRNRAKGQPFFSVINITTTHESRIRSRYKELKHDPAKAKLPPYYPDTPVVRKDWARYYDIITTMDQQVGQILRQLEDDGLAEQTIVWFWGDHGRGLPRAKRWLYDSGLHIPLLIRVPEKFHKLAGPTNLAALKPGTVNDDLISSIDFGPTVLSLAGIKVPAHIHGRPFLGWQKAPPRKYIFAARDRLDEAYDIIRAVRDKRFKYIRNFMPYVTYGRNIDYMNQMPTMKEMRRLNAAGKLKGPQKYYFLPTKPIEELYDTTGDPYEVHNLAGDPKYNDVLQRMRNVLLRWMKNTGDVGLIPEPDFDEMKRPGGTYQKTAEPGFVLGPKVPADNTISNKPYTVAINCPTPGASIAYRTDGQRSRTGWKLYSEPILLNFNQTILARACRLGFKDSNIVEFVPGVSASAAGQPKSEIRLHWRKQLDRTDLLDRLLAIKALDGKGTAAITAYLKALEDEYSPVRYWAVVGLHNTCKDAKSIDQARTALLKMLNDTSLCVSIAAAHALCDLGPKDGDREAQALSVLVEAMNRGTDNVRLYAATALGQIGEKARPAIPQLKAAMNDKYRNVGRVNKYTLKRLGRELPKEPIKKEKKRN